MKDSNDDKPTSEHYKNFLFAILPLLLASIIVVYSSVTRQFEASLLGWGLLFVAFLVFLPDLFFCLGKALLKTSPSLGFFCFALAAFLGRFWLEMSFGLYAKTHAGHLTSWALELDGSNAYAEAEQKYIEAIVVLEEQYGRNALELLYPIRLYALNLLQSSKVVGCLEQAIHALEISQQVPADNCALTLELIENIIDVLLENNRFEQAKELALKLGDLLERRGADIDAEALACVQAKVALVHLKSADFQEALVYFDQSIANYHKANIAFSPALATLLGNKALTLSELGQCDEAMSLCENTIDKLSINEPAHKEAYAFLLSIQGIICSRKLDYVKSTKAFTACLNFLKELGLEGSMQAGEVLFALGEAATKQGQFAEAQRYFSQALAVLEEKKSSEAGFPLYFNSLCRLFRCLHVEGQYGEALLCAARQIAIAEAMKSMQNMAVGLLHQCLALACEGKAAEARNSGVLALKIAEANLAGNSENDDDGDDAKLLLALVLNSLGVACDEAGQFEESLGYYQRALELKLNSALTTEESLVVANLNLAYALLELGRAEEASVHLLSVADKIERISLEYRLGYLIYLASLQRIQGKIESAQTSLLLALSLTEEHSFPEQSPFAFELFYSLAQLYLAKNSNEEASQFFRRSVASLEATVPVNKSKLVSSFQKYAFLLREHGCLEEAADWENRAKLLTEELES